MARDIVRLAWPVLVAQLAVIASGVLDTVMAGRYSAVALAAVGIGASVYFSVFIGLMGVVQALSPIAAQLFGGKQLERIGEETRQTVWLALGLGALGVLLLAFPEPFLRLSSAPPEVEARTRAYLQGIAWAPPAMLLFRVFFCAHHRGVPATRGHGDQPRLFRRQDPAQRAVHLRGAGRARARRSRLRGRNRDRELADLRPRLDLLRKAPVLRAVSHLQPVVLAPLAHPLEPPEARRTHRSRVFRRGDFVHFHGAVPRAARRSHFGRTPDRVERYRRPLHVRARDRKRDRGAYGAGDRRGQPARGAAYGAHRHRDDVRNFGLRRCGDLPYRASDRGPVHPRPGGAVDRDSAYGLHRLLPAVRHLAGGDRQRFARLQDRLHSHARLYRRALGDRTGRRLRAGARADRSRECAWACDTHGRRRILACGSRQPRRRGNHPVRLLHAREPPARGRDLTRPHCERSPFTLYFRR